MKKVLGVCPVGSAPGAWWSQEYNSARTHWNGLLVTSGESPVPEGWDHVAGDKDKISRPRYRKHPRTLCVCKVGLICTRLEIMLAL